MLTQTSESAIKALVYLTLRGDDKPVSPREIAGRIGASPTYMAKIARLLVKADILRSYKGALGGVTLSRHPSRITLHEIVEACQGRILASYCDPAGSLEEVCAFHRAMFELHAAIIGVLSKWSLADLAAKLSPDGNVKGVEGCRMNGVRPAKKGISDGR